MNPGGVRGDLVFNQSSGGELPGEVTYGEMFTVQPFSNTLVVKTCTGAQIDTILEQQFTAARQLVLLPSDSLRYSWSVAAPFGSKVDPASIKIDGVTVNPASSYRVTMNSFLADGGDGFPGFRVCTNPLGGEVDLDARAFGTSWRARRRSRRRRSPASPGFRSHDGGGGSGRPHRSR